MTGSPPPVLTVATLEREGLAHDTTTPTGTRYDVAPSGRARLLANQADRAAWFLAHPDEMRAASCRAVANARREEADHA